jgi:Sulfotransferase family
MPDNLSNPFTWIKLYTKTYFGSRPHRDIFAGVETYCMFLGYPRSGHSLVGSLLDAHPNVIIAHELDVLKYVNAGFSKGQIFYLLLENSRRLAARGRGYSGYSYVVANQWQGRHRELRVIGDKKGGRSSTRLHSDPALLDALQKTIGLPTKFVHVIRNPFDSITTMTLKNRRNYTLENRVENYFSRAATVAGAKKRIDPADLLDIRQEALIADPRKCLIDLCRLLGVEPLPDYLEDCARIIFKSPQKSRHKIAWSADLIRRVEQEMRRYPFFDGYSFAD